jgi:hypothetical protein
MKLLVSPNGQASFVSPSLTWLQNKTGFELVGGVHEGLFLLADHVQESHTSFKALESQVHVGSQELQRQLQMLFEALSICR